MEVKRWSMSREERSRPISLCIPVSAGDPSQIGSARRQASTLASSLGFSETPQGQLAIVVNEAAGNIAAHAGQGELLLCPWRFGELTGIDVLALDNGKGIADIARSFEDGYSTAGTAGEGLGAMSRLAATLQLYSHAGKGTVLLARVLQDPDARRDDLVSAFGVVQVPIAGETECGDAWSSSFSPGRSVYMVADGLGHGRYAAEAAEQAIRVFEGNPGMDPASLLNEVHPTLAKTRGAAVSVAEIRHDAGELHFAGVGNVAGAIYHAGKLRNLVGMNGTLGHSLGRVQSFTYPWAAGDTLLMHSDGLATRWNLESYPGLASRHPSLIAGVLYRDFCRRRDDVTILVTRV